MSRNHLRFFLTVAIYLLAALVVAMIFHSDMLYRLTNGAPEKVGMPLLGPRTDAGDNYHYYTYAKNGLKECTSGLDEANAGNVIACTFTGALLVSHGLYVIASALAPTMRYEVAFTLILHTALPAFALIVCLAVALRKRLSLGGAIFGAGALFFLLGNFALSFYFGFPYKYFASLYVGEPDVMRILNPTVFWALGLFSLAAIIHAIRNPSLTSLLGSIFLAILLASASIAVAGTLLCGLVLYLVVELIIARRLCNVALFCVATLLLCTGGTLWLFKMYWATEMGQAFNHGQFLGVTAKTGFLYLMAPIIIGRIAPDGGAVDRLLKSLLFAAMCVGIFCDSVEFGGRLWLRGAVIYALFCCAAWIWTSISVLISRFARRSNGEFIWHARTITAMNFGAIIVAPLILFVVLLICRPWNQDTWRGYMERDKYDILIWLDQHAKRGDVIASSNLDDSYVIPYYTRASILVPVFGLTILSPTESIKRYFYVLSLLKDGDSRVSGILKINDEAIEAHFRFLSGNVKEPYNYTEFQKVAFYESLIYYPYNNNYKDILKDPQLHQHFTENMYRLKSASMTSDYGFSYLVLRIDEPLMNKNRLKEVYRNKTFVILASATT